MPLRGRMCRKRGKTRKLKYTWKSAGHPAIRKRIGDGKQQPCKQYSPCGCTQSCGKECPCILNSTCCEKYCGYVIYLCRIRFWKAMVSINMIYHSGLVQVAPFKRMMIIKSSSSSIDFIIPPVTVALTYCH
jgi:hypothetical protein